MSGWNDFSEVREGRFFFFCYKTIEIRCGRRREGLYIPLIVRHKREEGFLFFFLRGTFEVVEKKISRYFITSYYTFSFSTKYQNVMKRRIKAYRVETYVSFERNLKELH